MSCGGSHLGFPIGIKKRKLCRGPSNDHSWAVWFQLSKWFQRRSVLKHFSRRLTFLEHPSSVPVFSYTIFSFMCMLCRSLFVLLSCFAIVLSVLRVTDLISYYPFRLWYLETLLKKSCYSFSNRLLC